MIVLADNDILIKLCALDLLDEALSWFGIDRKSVRVLDSAEPYVRKHAVRLETRYGSEAIRRLREFLHTATPTRCGPLDEVDLLRDVVNIEAGEAILIGATGEYPDVIFLTDDKRCLIALHESAACRKIAERLEGRAYCLAQLLLGLIHLRGWDTVRSRVLANVQMDDLLRSTFQDADQIPEAVILARLRSYVAVQRSKTGNLLGSRTQADSRF